MLVLPPYPTATMTLSFMVAVHGEPSPTNSSGKTRGLQGTGLQRLDGRASVAVGQAGQRPGEDRIGQARTSASSKLGPAAQRNRLVQGPASMHGSVEGSDSRQGPSSSGSSSLDGCRDSGAESCFCHLPFGEELETTPSLERRCGAWKAAGQGGEPSSCLAPAGPPPLVQPSLLGCGATPRA